ncbi:putative F-box protein PP2-B12 [Phoenix dactylifera]|uniref:F-box protein PP2-B12 n=1 Tax=Phoenix dactylifera TaxID=42345 RepID=A0A8B8ZZX6_PHODC|nr:putative F-box protein PP2-B12 [Phoenix dactylifera]
MGPEFIDTNMRLYTGSKNELLTYLDKKLPKECLYHLISSISPHNVCRLLAVSTTFLSAAMSDDVWKRFLPIDYQSILSRAINLVEYVPRGSSTSASATPSSSRTASFALEKSSGAKCYMLSARKLSFAVYGLTMNSISLPNFWSVPPFLELFDLMIVSWLSLSGDSSDTGTHVSKQTSCLRPDKLDTQGSKRFYRRFMSRLGIVIDGVRAPCEREDAWMEIEMGEFYNNEGEDAELEMSLTQMDNEATKRGLIIQGIQIRPKK